MEDLKNGSLEFVIVGEFLIDLKKEFGGGDNETMKVEELKKIEQKDREVCTRVQKSSKRK